MAENLCPISNVEGPRLDRRRESAHAQARSAAELRRYFLVKRIMDIFIAACSVVPALASAWADCPACEVGFPGPVIFCQERMGWNRRKRHGQPFVMYKFRTMHRNCDQATHQEFVRRCAEESNGKKAATKYVKAIQMAHDQRVTRFGRALRRTSLDELPQLWNVLKGDMSLVGPRPVPTYEVDQYNPWQKSRLEATPGITGLWQVTARGYVTLDEWVQLDIQYIERQSLRLDLKLLLLTVPAVLIGRGAV